MGEAGPAARFYHGLAYDPVRDITLLLAGTKLGEPPYFADTWAWDGSHWQNVTPQTALPAGRALSGLAYSSVHGGVVLVGGITTSSTKDALDDAWLWNGAWAPLDLPQPRPRVAGHELRSTASAAWSCSMAVAPSRATTTSGSSARRAGRTAARLRSPLAQSAASAFRTTPARKPRSCSVARRRLGR